MVKNFFIVIICFILLSLWGFYLAIRPFRFKSDITPEHYNLKYENVSFRTQDNLLLSGWFIPSEKLKANTIILLHGYPADKGNILPAMIFLHENYNMLFLDFRYFGKSEGSYTTVGKNEILDLLAAIKYLKSRGIGKVGVWGFSMGGAVAIMTAPYAPEIKAIIAESSYASLDLMAYDYYRIPFLRFPLAEFTRFWGWVFLGYDAGQVSPVDAAKKIKIPILIMHSEQDNVISFKHALLLQDALRHNPRAKVIFSKHLSHGQFVDNYQRIILDFFNKNLGKGKSD